MNKPQSKLEVWILASRPKTLPAAASPVLVGSALAFYVGKFQLFPAIAALLAALLLQVGANLANDLFDFHKGADAGERLGPTRVTQAGLLSPKHVERGMWVIFGLAALLGVYLIWVAGLPVVLIGLASILAALAYTGGPFPFGYYGLGDLFVFIFFGLAAVCGTFYVQTGFLNWLVVWSSIPMGFLITAILVVNNLRDIHSDRLAGKKTLAVRLGAKGARWEFLFCLIAAWSLPLGLWLTGLLSAWIMISWGTIVVAIPLVQQVWNWTGRPLNKTLAGTGRLTLVYAILFSIGVLLSV